MSTLKNVAIIAASGTLGSVVLKKLRNCGDFNIRVVRRRGSSSVLPSGVEVVDVDYSSQEALVASFKDQDVVLSFVPTFAAEFQITFIDAAAEAGVRLFIPSEFSANLENAKARLLPVFAPKVKVQEYLLEKSRATGLSYTFIYCGGWLDAGPSRTFIINSSGGTTQTFDGGNIPISISTMDTVADAVVGVLKHPAETMHRSVFVHDIVASQNYLISLAKKVAPNLPFRTQDSKLNDLTARSDERLSRGLLDMETFGPYIFRAIFDPNYGSVYDKTDNELLEIKEKSDEDIMEVFRSLLKQ